jgi:hypothetical protein
MRFALGGIPYLFLSLWCVVSPGAVASQDGHRDERAPSAESVRQLIAQEGPRRTLDRLTQDEVKWLEVLQRVSSGSPAWVKIAAQLRPVADGGPGEEIVISIQDALPIRTKLILRIVQDGGSFTAADVCGNYGSGQIEDERPKCTVLALIHRRQHAVRAVGDPSLRVAKTACLDQLGRLERWVKAKTPWPPNYDRR